VSRPPVEVRRACVDDLEDLLLLWAGSREELSRSLRQLGGLPPDQMRPRLREALAAREPTVLLARYEGAPAGYAVLRLAPVLAIDGEALHLDQLHVLAPLRRHGVGRALLVAATQIAERAGADQMLAGAPPGARDSHRFLARLGFSPLVVRRVVATSALRRRLTGEGQRRGLEDLLSRRRSLKARAVRAGWAGSWASMGRSADDDAAADTDGDAPGADVRPADDTLDLALDLSTAVAMDVATVDELTHIDLGRRDAEPIVADCEQSAELSGGTASAVAGSLGVVDVGGVVDVPAQGCPDAVPEPVPGASRRRRG
jgi:GNAT superfamily N-acetyltransferase